MLEKLALTAVFFTSCSTIKEPPKDRLHERKVVLQLIIAHLIKLVWFYFCALNLTESMNKKKGGGVRNPCCSVAEVTEIRRGVAWRVNGKETLKRGGLVAALLPETLGGWNKKRSTPQHRLFWNSCEVSGSDTPSRPPPLHDAPPRPPNPALATPPPMISFIAASAFST